MQIKYNAVMSGAPPAIAAGLHGNRYTTTIHLLLSALDKLRQVLPSPLPLPLYLCPTLYTSASPLFPSVTPSIPLSRPLYLCHTLYSSMHAGTGLCVTQT